MQIFVSPSGLKGETIHGGSWVDGVVAAMQQTVVGWLVPSDRGVCAARPRSLWRPTAPAFQDWTGGRKMKK